MKILALDFDGVVADSQYEALYTSFHAYLILQRGTKLMGGRRFGCGKLEHMKRKYKAEVREYTKLRPYVIKATDYYVILYALDRKIKINSYADFKFFAEKTKRKAKEFNKVFYRLRKAFQSENLDSWCRLSRPYSRIIGHYKKIKKFKIVFITNNETASLISTLAGLNMGVKKETIFDRKRGLDKKAKLNIIAEKYNVRMRNIHFVDDQVESLIKAKELGVNSYLAVWGYNNKEQRKKSKKEGIVLLTQKDFTKRFR